MIKRAIPFWKKHWVESIEFYLGEYDFWHDGIIEELENKIKEIVKRKHALVVNSCSNAIFMALQVWSERYPMHDDVMMPNWGYPAAAKACKVMGLNPNPVEIDKWSLGMNQQSVTDYMGSTTLACVHIGNNGVIGDPESIKEVLYDDTLFIEDCAPSILQDTAGIHGDISMFSFSPTKPLMAGEGAVMLMDDDDLYESLKLLRHTPNYDNMDGSLNFNLSPFLAAFLLPQFQYLDELAEMRSSIHAEYKKYLNIFEEPYVTTNNHGAIMYLSEKAEQISKKLDVFNIQHRYKYYPCVEEDYVNFPVSCEVRDQIIDLPLHHELTNEQIKFICNVIRKVEDE